MNRTVTRLFAIVVSLAGNTAALAQTISVVGAVWCPNNCYPDSDKPGIMLEIARAALESQGHSLTYTERPWSRAVLETRLGEFDALIGPSKTDAPDFIFPQQAVAIARNCFFTKRDSSWHYNGIQSLSEMRLGIGKDETVSEEIDRYITSADSTNQVVTVSGSQYLSRLLTMLLSDRISTVIADQNVFNYLLQTEGKAHLARIAGCMDNPLKIYLAFSPKKYAYSSAIIKDFDRGVQLLRSNGEFEHIIKRYNGSRW